MLNPRFPFTRSYYPPTLLEKYARSSYRSYGGCNPLCYKAALDPTMGETFTFNTNINVKEGDTIVAIQWITGTDNNGYAFAPTDNLGSRYKEPAGGEVDILGDGYPCGTAGIGAATLAEAPKSGTLSVNFKWANPTDTVPGYVVYVLHGQKFSGIFSAGGYRAQQATGNSVSISVQGVATQTYKYNFLVFYVANNPCTNNVPSISAQGLTQVQLWGDSCLSVCSPAVATLSDALYFGYKYSPTDFSFNVQFTYAGTTIYGYCLVQV